MHFYCSCGYRISDTTDFLPYKGYLLADQDEPDYNDAIEEEIMNENITKQECVDNIVISHGLNYWGRAIYQCPDCGRLFIEDACGKSFFTFVPEKEESKQVLLSKDGENWKGFLYADWYDEKPEWLDYPGHIEIRVNKPYESLSFTDKNEFEKSYYQLFEKLKEEGILRSAIMKRNKEWIHHWFIDKGEI